MTLVVASLNSFQKGTSSRIEGTEGHLSERGQRLARTRRTLAGEMARLPKKRLIVSVRLGVLRQTGEMGARDAH